MLHAERRVICHLTPNSKQQTLNTQAPMHAKELALFSPIRGFMALNLNY